jgi:hypothetical protein
VRAGRTGSGSAPRADAGTAGLPYGNHNFFYTWVDTPDSNYPPPLSAAAVEVGLPVMERTGHVPITDAGSIFYMIIAGANQRALLFSPCVCICVRDG